MTSLAIKKIQGKAGFSLVEMMIIVAIVAVLASVAIPAYVNYINRTRQSEAVTALMTAKLDQDVFYADHLRYAGTIGCLQSFSDTDCWNNCVACTRTSYFTNSDSAKNYEVEVADTSFVIRASRWINYANTYDVISISSTQDHPVIERPEALQFSLIGWLID